MMHEKKELLKRVKRDAHGERSRQAIMFTQPSSNQENC